MGATQTFLPNDPDTVLTVFDVEPGGHQRQDGVAPLHEPKRTLTVQTAIAAFAAMEGSAATLSFLDQSFSQCVVDPGDPTKCQHGETPIHPLLLAGDYDSSGDAEPERHR